MTDDEVLTSLSAHLAEACVDTGQMWVISCLCGNDCGGLDLHVAVNNHTRHVIEAAALAGVPKEESEHA